MFYPSIVSEQSNLMQQGHFHLLYSITSYMLTVVQMILHLTQLHPEYTLTDGER